jgi:DNA polymerase-4
VQGGICPACRSPRILSHQELFTLTIAHVDCDAFFASVEKRDRPELADRPVIVGGGVRGVVTTACYIARLQGVGSAMPMFKALKLCPDAVVVKPDFAKYVAAARAMRALMEALTPLVQPLSIDEAALDLAGTQALHGAPPAVVLANFARDVERQIGVTVSIGLARNRLLAKLAAGRDKPRGFAVFGEEAAGLLAAEPVGILPGVGAAMERRLAARGLVLVGQLQALDDRTARSMLGDEGPSLVRRARGEDTRGVDPVRAEKSISAETTFDGDLADQLGLERHLWRLAERLAARLREKEYAAAGVVLKLKTATFASRTRTTRLAQPTALPDTLFEAGRALLAREVDGTCFRLIGIGASGLARLSSADQPDLADPDSSRRVARSAAIEVLRARFGAKILNRGRGQEGGGGGGGGRPPFYSALMRAWDAGTNYPRCSEWRSATRRW